MKYRASFALYLDFTMTDSDSFWEEFDKQTIELWRSKVTAFDQIAKIISDKVPDYEADQIRSRYLEIESIVIGHHRPQKEISHSDRSLCSQCLERYSDLSLCSQCLEIACTDCNTCEHNCVCYI